MRDGEFGPVVEDESGLRAGPALHLRFYGPWDGGSVVPLKNHVGHYGVEVFRVDEEAVHVEKGSADAGWWGSAVKD